MNGDTDYIDGCQHCKHTVSLTCAIHRQLMPLLFFDKRTGEPGVHGLGIKPPGLPEYGLHAGLRIEPSEDLLDVGALFTPLQSYPFTITLWNMAKESIAKRQCPFFDMELGTSINRTLSVETLHCFNLGIYLAMGGSVVWAFIENCVWVRGFDAR